MNKNEVLKEWLEIAKVDLESARFLQKMRPIPLEIICYHCQQSAEKYLKAFLFYNNHKIIKSHDLLFLNNFCKQIDKSFEKIEEECLNLTDFGTNIRYPYPLELEEIDMKVAIKNASKIQNFVRGKIQTQE